MILKYLDDSNFYKKLINSLLIYFLIFITHSCDMGSQKGDDLIGKWTLSSELYSEYFSFHIDNTGYYEKRENTGWIQKDFTWNIKEGNYYKILETNIGNYEYYFNINKDKIYIKLPDKLYFKKYTKIKKY